MGLNDLCLLLASLYPTAKEAVKLAQRSSFPIQYIDTEGSAVVVWSSLLSEAIKRKLLIDLLKSVRDDYPGIEIEFDTESKSHAQPPAFDRKHPSVDLQHFEKLTGQQSTLLPISFLRVGILRARSVVRIRRSDGVFGTGFLISDNLLVTNNHVISTPNEAKIASVDCGYELLESGRIEAEQTFALNPQHSFHTSEEDDWTIVYVDGSPNEKWGALEYAKELASSEQFVNIVQHPGGGPKQIALYHNVVIYRDNKRLQYLTDTMPGSSGSPVFNSQWEVVGLHHAGGWLNQPGSSEPIYCNEGISSDVLVKALELI